MERLARLIRRWLFPAILTIALLSLVISYLIFVDFEVPSVGTPYDEVQGSASETTVTQPDRVTKIVKADTSALRLEKTVQQTDIPMPSTPTDTPIPTDTPMPTVTPTSTNTATPTITPTSTNTPTPTPRPPSIEVLANTLNVRRGPGRSYPVVREVEKGTIIIVQSRNLDFDKDPWFLIKINPNGEEEWITGDTRYVRWYNVANLSYRRGPATPTPVVWASNIRDFGGIQGASGWTYLVERGRNSGHWQQMMWGQYRSQRCWLTSESDVRICPDGEVHPGQSTRIAYEWRANVERDIQIRVHAHKIDTRCGDGVKISVHRGVEGQGLTQLGEFRIAYNDNRGITETYPARMAPGVLIYVIVDIYEGSTCDATKLDVQVFY